MTNASENNLLLLVDDNLNNLQVLYESLESEGYELLVANSGERALNIAEKAKPAVILLDINMPPGIDGYETCKRLKGNPETADSVVVFLSARGDVEDKLKGFETGAVDYIQKPFHFEEVIARVHAHHQSYLKQKNLEAEKEFLSSKLRLSFNDFNENTIKELILEGESEHLEFKSTLRWNLHTDKSDKRLENACLKSVAGFLNSEGGILLVGVQDDGNIIGMETDKFQNEDKLLLHWNGLLKNHIGAEFSPKVNSKLVFCCQKQVLIVQVLKSLDPVFFRRDKDEIFYVRSGPSSEQLSPSELLAYITARQKDQ
ncbi:MAG: response regulator [Lentisphaeria bacterium]|nr:response regulator [Lentisphaeria bacterium]